MEGGVGGGDRRCGDGGAREGERSEGEERLAILGDGSGVLLRLVFLGEGDGGAAASSFPHLSDMTGSIRAVDKQT